MEVGHASTTIAEERIYKLEGLVKTLCELIAKQERTIDEQKESIAVLEKAMGRDPHKRINWLSDRLTVVESLIDVAEMSRRADEGLPLTNERLDALEISVQGLSGG